MDEYSVEFSVGARQDFDDIYQNGKTHWSFSDTDTYVSQITDRCLSLSHMPHRVGFDSHTRKSLTFRAFEHKAHKVFFTIDEDTKTVNIAAVLPGRTKYSTKL